MLPLVERLLALGSDFTRHQDALQAITLLPGPHPARLLHEPAPTTDALAEQAHELSKALGDAELVYRSPAVRAAIERTVQLAGLCALATDHLLDAADILEEYTGCAEHGGARGQALLKAGSRTVLAGRLTALGTEDCLATARLTPATVRNLDGRGLLQRRAAHPGAGGQRLHLTTDGIRALATALRHPATATSGRGPARPPTAQTRSASR